MPDVSLATTNPSLHHRYAVRIDRHHIGPAAGREPPAPMVEAQKFRRMDRRKAQSEFERNIQQAHAIAHRRRHIERRACKDTVAAHTCPVLCRDVFAVESKYRVSAADRWHRIGHQYWPGGS